MFLSNLPASLSLPSSPLLLLVFLILHCSPWSDIIGGGPLWGITNTKGRGSWLKHTVAVRRCCVNTQRGEVVGQKSKIRIILKEAPCLLHGTVGYLAGSHAAICQYFWQVLSISSQFVPVAVARVVKHTRIDTFVRQPSTRTRKHTLKSQYILWISSGHHGAPVRLEISSVICLPATPK